MGLLTWSDDFSIDHFTDSTYTTDGAVEGTAFTVAPSELDIVELGFSDPRAPLPAGWVKATVSVDVAAMEDTADNNPIVVVGFNDAPSLFPGLDGSHGWMGGIAWGGAPAHERWFIFSNGGSDGGIRGELTSPFTVKATITSAGALIVSWTGQNQTLILSGSAMHDFKARTLLPTARVNNATLSRFAYEIELPVGRILVGNATHGHIRL